MLQQPPPLILHNAFDGGTPEKRPKLLQTLTTHAVAIAAAHQLQLSSTVSELSDHESNMVIDDDYEEDVVDDDEEAAARNVVGDDKLQLARTGQEDINENYDDGEYVDDGEVVDDDYGEVDDEAYILLAGNAVTSASAGGGTLTSAPGGEKEDLGPLHKRCPVCHMIMLKKNLSRHVRDQHTTERPRSVCPVCKKTYKTADWLKDHIRRGHGYSKEATDEVMAMVKAEHQGDCGSNSNGSSELAGSELVSSSPIQQAS